MEVYQAKSDTKAYFSFLHMYRIFEMISSRYAPSDSFACYQFTLKKEIKFILSISKTKWKYEGCCHLLTPSRCLTRSTKLFLETIPASNSNDFVRIVTSSSFKHFSTIKSKHKECQRIDNVTQFNFNILNIPYIS